MASRQRVTVDINNQPAVLAAQTVVQRDWENREFVTNIQLSIMKMVDFLNKFDTTTRYKLSKVNEKLTKLERNVDLLEASLKNVDLPDAPQTQAWRRAVEERVEREAEAAEQACTAHIAAAPTSAAAASAAAAPAGPQVAVGSGAVEVVPGLLMEVVVPGNGANFPSLSSVVQVHYTGSLEDGRVFDSSAGKAPYQFPLGAGQIIQGLEQALLLMSIGQLVRITVQPALGYGEEGISGVIPPNAVLKYEVQLLAIF
eukprot:TRINITY_DN1752_c0_g3_i3.p1 TRINITY_DN1752_c0_g3~~TRINITY_DN1752_c0_g3_i3.p1  ORF type:complete len:273 (+),score=67.65 TRINITY_DN1752_c0_g3_i3:53-820(+)